MLKISKHICVDTALNTINININRSILFSTSPEDSEDTYKYMYSDS